MSSSVGEPFQLFLSSALSQPSENYEAIYCTHNRDFPSYATVTAQSDGIHIWDLQNLHAVTSYSVGQKVTFMTPAFSLYVTEDGNKSVISYVVVGSAPGLARTHQGRTIWAIRQKLTGSTVSASEKTAIVVEDPPVQIRGTGRDTVPLLFISKNAGLSLANAQVDIKSRLDWPGEHEHLETFVFPREPCNFVHSDTDSWSSIAVTCCQTNMSLHVRLVLLGEEILPAGTCEILFPSLHNDTNIVVLGVTCSTSGILSFVDSRGIWATYQLASVNSSLVSTLASENLRLRDALFLDDQRKSKEDCFSVVSLGTSLVLLATQVKKNQNISLQVWDLAYGALLTEQLIPASSSLRLPKLRFTVADEGQVLLTVSVPRICAGEGDPMLSSVHVIPIDAQLKSSLAAVIGKMASTTRWLVPGSSGPTSKKFDPTVETIFKKIRKGLRDRLPQKAERTFLKWVNSHSSKEALLGYEFVKKVFSMILPPKPRDAPYMPRIVRCLLENAVVSTIMLDGRLITRLRQRGDWENLMYALTTVKDVTEDELISPAKYLIDRQRRNENAMDVDASRGYVPPLWTYLFACVSYPFSAAPMRLAIRKHLHDAQDLVLVLEILEGWLQGGTEYEMEALLKSLARDTQMPSSVADSPPYSKVIMFLQALLDASFVVLLQHQPSHDLLGRILSYIEPEITLIESLEPLRGMLEPFAKAQSFKAKTGMSNESPTEWKQRKKQLEQRDGLGIGLYRLEELVI